MMLLQKFLAENSTDKLTELFGINVKRHGEFPNLVMFKYSQTGSPMSEPIVRECRGVILDEAEGWSVVSRPYDKFFNLGEGHASPIDWSSARVYEKLDGSLMTLYWYAGKWRVASSGMPDAAGPVLGSVGTFAELFWQAFALSGYILPDGHTWGHKCFMFELMTPHNRVVVPHSKPRLVLHGVRDREKQFECPPAEYADWFGWECVKSFPLTTAEECTAAAAVLAPMECEGYVVCDAKFNRVKIKSPKYVALAHAKEGFTQRRVLELVRLNEGDEFLAYFPEMRPEYEKTASLFTALVQRIGETYAVLQHIPAQKDFAAAALKHPYSAVLFSIRAKKFPDASAFLRACTIQAVERMVGVESVEMVEVMP